MQGGATTFSLSSSSSGSNGFVTCVHVAALHKNDILGHCHSVWANENPFVCHCIVRVSSILLFVECFIFLLLNIYALIRADDQVDRNPW
jgi:hypothetical protein